jgi:hypothetical protein
LPDYSAVCNLFESNCGKFRIRRTRGRRYDRQPKLAVETGLMALDGTVEMFG